MIKLGDKVNDTLTGFYGVVIAKSIYLNGCVQYLIQPKGLKDDGGKKDSEWIDEGQLIITEKAEIVPDKAEKDPGGGVRKVPSGLNHP